MNLLDFARGRLSDQQRIVDAYVESITAPGMEPINPETTWDEEMNTLAMCLLVEDACEWLAGDGVDLEGFFRDLVTNKRPVDE